MYKPRVWFGLRPEYVHNLESPKELSETEMQKLIEAFGKRCICGCGGSCGKERERKDEAVVRSHE